MEPKEALETSLAKLGTLGNCLLVQLFLDDALYPAELVAGLRPYAGTKSGS
jgi:hypothetical protein